jgi:hypothetical protein
LAEWIVEEGIGETRAALIEAGGIVEARVEREAGQLSPGAILAARLVQRPAGRRHAIARSDGGEELLLDPAPAGVTEGGALLVEVTRSALPERGNPKRAKARAADPAAVPRPAPGLVERLTAEACAPVRLADPHGRDLLEEAGWGELIDEAESGSIPFPGGLLRLSLTPAMTLLDVDGSLDSSALAVAGAAAAGAAIRRLGLGGSIGIDLPTVDKAARQAAAAAIDAALPVPFERTAVNGFGFLQLVLRRERASLPELIQGDRPFAAALALVRRAERSSGRGRRTLIAAPPVLAALNRVPGWQIRLERRLGAPVSLMADPSLTISGGHVEAEHP